jgi:hypothetical protein
MSAPEFPVTVAINRPDGTVDHVRVGTAVRVADTFQLSFGELHIGTVADAPRRPAASASPMPAPPSDGGMVFPPYGRSKGAPISGASIQDLEFYASGCRRTLGDPAKSRWHDKERQLLAAIEAELGGQGAGGGGGGGARSTRRMDEPPPFDDIPARGDEDVPF